MSVVAALALALAVHIVAKAWLRGETAWPVQAGNALAPASRWGLSGRTRQTARRTLPGSTAWLARAGAGISPAQFGIACALAGSCTGFAAEALLGAPVLGLVAGMAGATCPIAYWEVRGSQRRDEVTKAWPDVVRFLVGSLGAGIATLHDALEELSRSGPVALRPVFARYGRLSYRIGDKGALEVVREELADPVADPVLIALGGAVDEGTATALRALADIGSQITEDLQLTERARTAQAQSRLATWGCFAVPYVLAAFLCATNATYRAYFSSSAGFVVVGTGACLSVSGLLVCLRLARPVRADRRVFTSAGHG